MEYGKYFGKEYMASKVSKISNETSDQILTLKCPKVRQPVVILGHWVVELSPMKIKGDPLS